jgi:hypothetical protein
MFDPAKSFFLCRGHEFAVLDQAGGGISVISVKAENEHEEK